MPRSPRYFFETSFFHVIVQGINKEYIFEKKNYIEKYLNLLNKHENNFKVNIVSYCIMSNHAHILLHTENISEMSNFMHRVNSEYARYYNYVSGERVGYVFKDRFKSEPIKNEKYLINCINYIHQNPVKANIVSSKEKYPYSSYKEYLNKSKIKLLSKLLNTNYDISFFTGDNCKYIFEDIETDVNAIIDNKVNEFLEQSNFCKEEVLKDKIVLKILVKYLKNIGNIKYTDMMKNLEITKGKMETLKKQ